MANVKLRGGFSARDVRLDRLPVHDPRSRKFLVRRAPVAAGKAPRSYTWRCDSWLDQGAEGACVGFGVAHELAARPAVVPGLTNQFARERLYWEAQKIDEWDGGAYPGARPRYEGTSVTAGVKVAHRLGAMESYHWAYTVDDLVLGLGYAGPAVLGLDWWTGMFDPDSKGLIHVDGQVEGGHCILAIGVSIPTQTVLLHNSWGKGWGVNGRARISFADLRRLFSAGGEACFFVGRKNKLIA